MSWRDELQPCSIRGVACLWRSVESEGGRRVAVHEYPLRDDSWAEDLGGKDGAFTAELYVIGADYMSARDALIDALEARGPCELVHPTRGRIQVQPGVYRLTESTREGGYARVSCTLHPAGEQRYPAAAIDTGRQVADRADEATDAAEAAFARDVSVDGMPGWVADAAVVDLSAATDAIEALQGRMPTIPDAAPRFVADAAALRGEAEILLRTPSTLAARITGLIRSAVALASEPLDIPAMLRGLASFGDLLGVVPESTPAREQQAKNRRASVDLVHRAALIEEARAAATAAPASSADAIALRTSLAERLDAGAATAADPVFIAMNDLRAAVVRDLTERAARLPRLASFRPAATMPSVLLAQRLYGDASRADELAARNHIRHPGFVPAGVPVEYLV